MAIEKLSAPLRTIRSFVRRESRMSNTARLQLQELWPQHGADAAQLADPIALFGRDAPLHVEIGFGKGDSLLALAQAHPECNVLGMEVYRPGAAHCMAEAARLGLHNLRIAIEDAKEVLETKFPDAAITALYVFFPDPWPKKRHHKRRLINPEFAALAARKLHRDGIWRLATDWAPYAEQMLAVLNAEPGLRNESAERGYVPRPDTRPLTRFEQRGQRLGHAVFDLAYSRV
ncbi:MAG: tRNA (guanosine(46)-N7)-methyltransferase TrmB [Gammaproteobacteria bacterium]|nr:tRNA (guanosine(46)-N7)-methyltransferase TrmB [Gammaproteobacteria bacterium]